MLLAAARYEMRWFHSNTAFGRARAHTAIDLSRIVQEVEDLNRGLLIIELRWLLDCRVFIDIAYSRLNRLSQDIDHVSPTRKAIILSFFLTESFLHCELADLHAFELLFNSLLLVRNYMNNWLLDRLSEHNLKRHRGNSFLVLWKSAHSHDGRLHV